jgi:hypothetical protein
MQFNFATQLEKDVAVTVQRELLGNVNSRLVDLEAASVDPVMAPLLEEARANINMDESGVLPVSTESLDEAETKKTKKVK